MTQREANPWRFRYKGQAIRYAAQALSALIPADWRANGTFVPIPPSRVKDDPDHDPRVLAVLQAIQPALTDVRELVLLRENVETKAKNVSPGSVQQTMESMRLRQTPNRNTLLFSMTCWPGLVTLRR